MSLVAAESGQLRLISDLASDNSEIVNQAIKSIEASPENLDDKLLNGISKLLDRDLITSSRCIFLLSRNGDNARKYLPELVQLLKSKDLVKRTYALFALGNIGNTKDQWLREIVRLHLSDEEPVAISAAMALKRLNGNLPRTLPENYPDLPKIGPKIVLKRTESIQSAK
jgi:HEAT repeat protein